MEVILLVLVAISFVGFLAGLAGKSRAVNKKSFRKNELYQRITIVSLVIMLTAAVIYSIVV
jgi:hypothetical protein